MTLLVHVRPAARHDMTAARDWYEAQAVGLGERLLREIDAAMALISAQPLAYPKPQRRSTRSRAPFSIRDLLRRRADPCNRLACSASGPRSGRVAARPLIQARSTRVVPETPRSARSELQNRGHLPSDAAFGARDARGRHGLPACRRNTAAARHHEGVAVDRQLHLRGLVLRGLKGNVVAGRLIPAGTFLIASTHIRAASRPPESFCSQWYWRSFASGDITWSSHQTHCQGLV